MLSSLIVQVPKSHSLADRISDKLTRHNSLRAPRKDKVSSEKKMPDPIKGDHYNE